MTNAQVDETVAVSKGKFAKRWNFGEHKMRTLIQEGLPVLKCGRRTVRIPVEDADAWLRERFMETK